MGCACVTKINLKDVDLNEDHTKDYQSELLNDEQIEKIKTSDNIFKVQKSNLSNLKKKNKSKSKSKNKNKKPNISQKLINLNSPKDFKVSGPIITLLKNRVDNYHHKKKM